MAGGGAVVATLERILLASGFSLHLSLRADRSEEERRHAEVLESVLELVDAFPRNPSGPLKYPILATVFAR